MRARWSYSKWRECPLKTTRRSREECLALRKRRAPKRQAFRLLLGAHRKQSPLRLLPDRFIMEDLRQQRLPGLRYLERPRQRPFAKLIAVISITARSSPFLRARDPHDLRLLRPFDFVPRQRQVRVCRSLAVPSSREKHFVSLRSRSKVHRQSRLRHRMLDRRPLLAREDLLIRRPLVRPLVLPRKLRRRTRLLRRLGVRASIASSVRSMCVRLSSRRVQRFFFALKRASVSTEWGIRFVRRRH
jgi:hypothetical protein